MSGMSKSRFFPNPYPDYGTTPTTAAVNIPKDDLKSNITKGLRNIFKKAAGKNLDGGLYVGASGLSYTYLHLAEIPGLLSDEEKETYRSKALEELRVHLKYYKEHSHDVSDRAAFLLGAAGVDALGAVFGKYCKDEKLYNECLKSYAQASKICQPIQFHHGGSDELFVGRAGYLCGALWLQQKVGGHPVPKEDLKKVWNTIIESGRAYLKQTQSSFPLMYAYYGTEYLGAAHGLCAILQILLSFPEFLQESPEALRYIRESVDQYLSLQDSEGNFPCAMDEVGPGRRRSEADMLVHWCHGAPGAVYLFAKAFLVFKDTKYLDSCIRCGEVVWKKGLLKKGPGICHGIAGSGLVFLTIYKVLVLNGVAQNSPEPQKYLYRALKFAEFLDDDKFESEARRPDCPYSLFEGDAGMLCFLGNLLSCPEKTSFPFFDISYNYNPDPKYAALEPIAL